MNKSTSNISMGETTRDVFSDKTKHYFGKDDFILSMGITSQKHSLLDDYMKQYLELRVVETKVTVNEDGGVTREIRPLRLETWGERYPDRNNASIKRYHLDKLVWVKDDDYYLKSNWSADEYTIMAIKLMKWDPATTPNCKSDEEINEFISGKYFQYIMIDRYFDPQNYTHPVGKMMTDQFYYTMHPEMTKQTHVYIKENKLELMDSFFQYGETKKSNFYSISEGFEDYKPLEDNTYVATYFLMDKKVTTYKRTIYSLFDMLAQLGGVFNFLYTFLYVFLNYYSEKMLQYSILRKCYQFSSNAPDKMPVFTESDIQKDNNLNKSSHEWRMTQAFSPIVERNKPSQTSNENIKKTADELATGPNLTHSQANDLAAIMKQRRRFDFSVFDFLYGILCPIKLLWWCCK